MACAGLFSATDLVSRLFLVVLQVLGTSIIKLGFVLVLNARILGDFITPNEEMSSGNDEMEAELDAEEMQEASRILLCIAKISEGLRKVRNHSENSLS